MEIPLHTLHACDLAFVSHFLPHTWQEIDEALAAERRERLKEIKLMEAQAVQEAAQDLMRREQEQEARREAAATAAGISVVQSPRLRGSRSSAGGSTPPRRVIPQTHIWASEVPILTPL